MNFPLFPPGSERGAAPARPERDVYSVSRLNKEVRLLLESGLALLWLEGELVHLEDLVLHDAGMDIRAPTHELTRARAVLRTRRRIAAANPDWALSASGLASLRGRGGQGDREAGIRAQGGIPRLNQPGASPAERLLDVIAQGGELRVVEDVAQGSLGGFQERKDRG